MPEEHRKENGTVAQTMSETLQLGTLQIKNILCLVDFSECSRNAFNYATCIARYFRSKVFLQHTVPYPHTFFLEGATPTAVDETLQVARHGAERELHRLMDSAKVELPEISILLNEGDIRDRALQSIAERKIDLLVMGTHGHKGFTRLVLGSVAEQIVHEVTCPVLVVSHPRRDFVAPEQLQPVHLNTLLLATDFSAHSGRALAYALNWASEWSGKVILIHAVEKALTAVQGRVELFPEYNPYFEKQIAEAWEKILMQVPEGANKNCEVSYEIWHGNAKDKILEVAEKKNADLIVMGAKGLGKSEIVWGSTISGVVRDGRFPVLALRHLPL